MFYRRRSGHKREDQYCMTLQSKVLKIDVLSRFLYL